MLDSLRDIASEEWRPVANAQLAAAGAGILVLFYWLAVDEDGFLTILDHVNLAFHEAGHLFFRPFGDTASLYGGTLGQLIMPAIAMIAFWRRRDTIGFFVAGVWFFQNFQSIARYMADARARLLPLVGGGDHDWFNIFYRWDALQRDTAIANLTSSLG